VEGATGGGHQGRTGRAWRLPGAAQEGRTWGKEEGEGKRERERGVELTSGSKSGDHRLQILGHNGEEREMEETRLLHGKIK
jgi:hypothetical protein